MQSCFFWMAVLFNICKCMQIIIRVSSLFFLKKEQLSWQPIALTCIFCKLSPAWSDLAFKTARCYSFTIGCFQWVQFQFILWEIYEAKWEMIQMMTKLSNFLALFPTSLHSVWWNRICFLKFFFLLNIILEKFGVWCPFSHFNIWGSRNTALIKNLWFH